MKQWSGSSSPSTLKQRSFASLVEWCASQYTSHPNVTCLYGIFTGCVNTFTDSGKSLAVWMNQNQKIPGWFPEHITRVFSGISVWKRLYHVSQACISWSTFTYRDATPIIALRYKVLQHYHQLSRCSIASFSPPSPTPPLVSQDSAFWFSFESAHF